MSAQASSRTATKSAAVARSSASWRIVADRSTDLSATLFIVSGVLWLIVGSLIALAAQFKLFSPEWLGEWRWLSYGRLYPMAQNALVYGWLSNVAIGIGIWLWARLNQTRMQGRLLLIVSGGLWNTGVALGLIGVMTGFSRSVEWLEMPLVAFAFLLPGALLLSGAFIQTLRLRRQSGIYISGAYLAASAIWLPFLLLTTLLPLLEGISGAVYAGWYAHGILNMWIVPVMLAAGYYLVPKLTGRAIYSYHLAAPAFWMFVLFVCWSGAGQLIGGPAPFWVSSTSIAFGLLLLVPVILISFNLLWTFGKSGNITQKDPAYGFLFFGVISFVLFGLSQTLSSLRWWNELTQFTIFESAQTHLGLYAFATMTAFGAVYYIVPRFTGRPWSSAATIRLHYLATSTGIGIYILASWFGGTSQGASLLDASVDFSATLSATWWWLQALGLVLTTAGHLIFAYTLYGNIVHHSNNESIASV